MTSDEVLAGAGLHAIGIRALSRFVEIVEGLEHSAELNALIVSRTAERGVVVRYRGRRVLLLNWKRLVLEFAPAVAGAAASLTSKETVAGIAGAIGALGLLIGAAQMELGEEHGRVVVALWALYPDSNPVAREALTKSVEMDSGRLDRVLRDLATLRVIGFGDDGAITKMEVLVLRPGRS